MKEGAPGIEAAHDEWRAQLVAVLQRDTNSAVAGEQHPLHRRIGPYLGAKRFRGARDRVRDRAGAPLLKAPGAECSIDLAHVMVQQHVRGAGGAWSKKSSDDAARGFRRLQRVE